MRPLSIRLAGVALAAVIVLPATAPAALAQADDGDRVVVCRRG